MRKIALTPAQFSLITITVVGGLVTDAAGSLQNAEGLSILGLGLALLGTAAFVILGVASLHRP